MSEPSERLFFALWPDNSLRQAMHDRFGEIRSLARRGRRVPRHNLHLTLHFLGNISLSRVSCFEECAARVRARPFELVLEPGGWFQRARVLWLGCRSVPAELLRLQSDLGLALSDCDYVPEARAFHPHVTMARKISGPVESFAIEAVHWPVDSFALIVSQPVDGGVRYRVRARYSLDGA